jgi:hypothetical protein
MKTETKKNLTVVALIVMLFVGLTLTHQDEVNEMSHYCQNVLDGTWPNYKEIDCE